MSRDIENVSVSCAINQPVTYFDTVGSTIKEPIAPVGSRTLSVEEWLGKARSFEITNAHIISFSLALVVLSFFAGAVLKSKTDTSLIFSGQTYVMVGVGEINDGNRKIYTPVYEVQK